MQKGMQLRPGETRLVHELHEVLDDVRQNGFQPIGSGSVILVYLTFIVNYS